MQFQNIYFLLYYKLLVIKIHTPSLIINIGDTIARIIFKVGSQIQGRIGIGTLTGLPSLCRNLKTP